MVGERGLNGRIGRRPSVVRPGGRSRGAVTLLEVLFAIGVVLIGLLGVASLVPVALSHAGRGNVADRASILGVRALHDFRVYGMNNPANWRLSNGAPVLNPSLNAIVAANNPNPLPGAPAPKPYMSGGLYLDYVPNVFSGAYCLDPEFVAVNRAAVAPPFNARVFPYYDFATPAEPRMSRISLVPTERAASATIARRSILTSGHAALLFQLQDELTTELPGDVTLPPVNPFQSIYPGADGRWGIAGTDDDNNGVTDDISEALAPNSDDFAARRLMEHNFSWLATIVPKRDRIGNFRDTYTLSIVIFNRRDPSMRAFEDSNNNGSYDTGELVYGNERLLNAEFPAAIVAVGGLSQGGGEVILRPRPNSPSPIEDLNIREGDWLMLGGSHTGGGQDDLVVDFQWYRVTGLDEIDTSGAAPNPPNPPSRTVTLVGPDWRIFNNTVQATIMPGVVTVYQETLQLETPGQIR